MEKGDDSADLVEFLAKALVSQPEEVNVIIEDDGDLIELETADNDLTAPMVTKIRTVYARAMRQWSEWGSLIRRTCNPRRVW